MGDVVEDDLEEEALGEEVPAEEVVDDAVGDEAEIEKKGVDVDIAEDEAAAGELSEAGGGEKPEVDGTSQVGDEKADTAEEDGSAKDQGDPEGAGGNDVEEVPTVEDGNVSDVKEDEAAKGGEGVEGGVVEEEEAALDESAVDDKEGGEMAGGEYPTAKDAAEEQERRAADSAGKDDGEAVEDDVARAETVGGEAGEQEGGDKAEEGEGAVAEEGGEGVEEEKGAEGGGGDAQEKAEAGEDGDGREEEEAFVADADEVEEGEDGGQDGEEKVDGDADAVADVGEEEEEEGDADRNAAEGADDEEGEDDVPIKQFGSLKMSPRPAGGVEGGDTFDWGEEHSRAAVKIQARHRGARDRQRVSGMMGGGGVKFADEEEEREEAGGAEEPQYDWGEDHRRAAVKIQARHRGARDRQRVAGLRGGGGGGSVRFAGEDEVEVGGGWEPQYEWGDDHRRAAVKIQARHRGGRDRQRVAGLRGGQQARLTDEDREEEEYAQGEYEKDEEELQWGADHYRAAVKIQARQRGAAGRRAARQRREAGLDMGFRGAGPGWLSDKIEREIAEEKEAAAQAQGGGGGGGDGDGDDDDEEDVPITKFGNLKISPRPSDKNAVARFQQEWQSASPPQAGFTDQVPQPGPSGQFFGDDSEPVEPEETRTWEEAEVFRPGSAKRVAESPRAGGRRVSRVHEKRHDGTSSFDIPGGASPHDALSARTASKEFGRRGSDEDAEIRHFGAVAKLGNKHSSDDRRGRGREEEARGPGKAVQAKRSGEADKHLLDVDHSPSGGLGAADRSRVIMERMDDPVMRGLNQKFNEIEHEIEEQQRRILRLVSGMGTEVATVDFSQISSANERVERLMQMREQVNVALVHQRRLRGGPASVPDAGSPQRSDASSLLDPAPPPAARRLAQPAPRRAAHPAGIASPRALQLAAMPLRQPVDEEEERRMDRKMPAGARQFVDRQRVAQERRAQDKFEEIRRVQYHVGKSHRRADDIERSQREGQLEREQKVYNRVIRNQVALENKFAAGNNRVQQQPVVHQPRAEPRGGMWGGGGLGAGGSLSGGRGSWGGGGGGFGGSKW